MATVTCSVLKLLIVLHFQASNFTRITYSIDSPDEQPKQNRTPVEVSPRFYYSEDSSLVVFSETFALCGVKVRPAAAHALTFRIVHADREDDWCFQRFTDDK